MSVAYRVKAVTAVVKVGGTEKYLHRGSIVPSAATNVEHLLAVGLVEEVNLLPSDVAEVDSREEVSGEQSGPEVLQSSDEDLPEPPAKAGPGSSAEAWRNYASAIGVEVSGNADRAEVIAALEAAGKPTE